MLTNTLLPALIATLVFSTSFDTFAKKSSNIGFTETVITSPYKISQDIITADILPAQGKELITFTVDDQARHLLVIYTLANGSNQYQIAEQTIIPKHFYRFDISKLSDEKKGKQADHIKTNKGQEKATQQLYFLSANTLAVYQHGKKNKFEKLSDIDSLYIHDRVDYLSRGNFIQNLNNDGFDDVIIADFNKTHVLIGQGLGSFAKQTLPIKPSSRIFSDGATYTETKLFFNDVNFDGKTDILLIGKGSMLIYRQYKNSLFSKKVTKVAINKTISATDWWNKRDESGDKLDQSNLSYRKLEELRDMNADGMVDLVVRFTKTSGVFDRVNDYEIFFGKKVGNVITYSQDANTVIHAEGTLAGLAFDDINNDNKLEVMLSGFDIGVSQIIGALITGAIDQDVYLFQMDKNDKFPSKPVIKKGVELTFSLSSGQSGSPIVQLADLNGDGLKDLVLSDDDDELKIYLGKKPSKDKKVFKKRRVSYDTQLPKNGNAVIVEDLNGDGKDEILMQFARLDGDGKEKEFKVLFSK